MNNSNLVFKEYKKEVALEDHKCVYSDYSKDYERCCVCGNLRKKTFDKPDWLKGN